MVSLPLALYGFPWLVSSSDLQFSEMFLCPGKDFMKIVSWLFDILRVRTLLIKISSVVNRPEVSNSWN